MFRIIGRLQVAPRRYTKYIVRFSTKWPENAVRLYLVSTFTSLFPGRFELKRAGGEGFIDVYLWSGVYPYWFSINGFTHMLDYENTDAITIKPLGYSKPITASLASIGVSEYINAIKGYRDWFDLVVHDENNSVFISTLAEYTIIRLWAPRGILNSVILEYRSGDGSTNEAVMDLVGSDDIRDYYEAWVKGNIKSYRFKLLSDTNFKYFGFYGINDASFIVPNNIIYYTPSWWLGSVFYMIFVDSFNRATSKKVRLIRRSAPRERGYYGGDLLGIIEKLDYISSLGVEAVYLTPLYLAASYHRYDVIDHLSIDPIVGSFYELRDLIGRAHSMGLRIILELVAHHTSPCHSSFIEYLKSGEFSSDSMYRFLVSSLSSIPTDILEDLMDFISRRCKRIPRRLRRYKPFYEAFLGSWNMPKLNHESLKTRDYIREVIKEYVTNVGIDGFRVDVGHAIGDEALREYYSYLKSLREDAILITEVTYGLEDYPLGYNMDSATNYDLREGIIRFIVEHSINAHELASLIARQYSKIPVLTSLSVLNLIGSHDTPRIRTLASHCYPKCVKQAYALLFMLPGSPAIYYGDEIGIEGGVDPDCRRPMIWDLNKWDLEMLGFIKRLISIRRSLAPLRLGSLKIKALNNDTLMIKRVLEDDIVYGLICRSREYTIDLDANTRVLIGESIGSNRFRTSDGVALATTNI
ncbi:MAG: glycoside hydrolase family 13 protein [Acidilobaceae archaeon]